MSVEVVENVVEGDGFCMGRFWCPPQSPLWNQENVIQRGPIFVVPMTGVEIEHTNTRPIVTNASRAMFYNADQSYRRRLLDDDGDRCFYFGLSGDAIHEVLEAHHAPHGEDGQRPFEWSWAPLAPVLSLRAYELYRRAEAGAAPTDATYEEVLTVLDGIVSAAVAHHEARAQTAVVVGPRALDAVDETLRLLVLHIDRSWTLAQLGKRVGLSPFHLARCFRACTGMTLHDCRDRLRVLYALGRLDSSTRLVDIALDAGYSSHSHLTQAFQRVLGQKPSEIRKRWRKPLLS